MTKKELKEYIKERIRDLGETMKSEKIEHGRRGDIKYYEGAVAAYTHMYYLLDQEDRKESEATDE